MDVQNAIARIQLAFKDKDYFRLMELPSPDVDELGRPWWSGTSADVSKAYRRLSILVHPDKNPGPDARAAFEALNKAHRELKDPGSREELVKAGAEAGRQKREAAEAAATPEERVVLYAARKEKTRELKKQEGDSFQAEIMRQLKEKQDRAKRKRDMLSRCRRQDEDYNAAEAEDAAEEAARSAARRQGAAKSRRGKPRLIF
ncbi:hypothetical protein WJX81_007267 [Elliptochloris bilobata]|uniref:J domain-containing protein n=1 Tax=Elliptochloris bilobata TaxID=381761 RepID=A0AAW1RRS2_9CHLO